MATTVFCIKNTQKVIFFSFATKKVMSSNLAIWLI